MTLEPFLRAKMVLRFGMVQAKSFKASQNDDLSQLRRAVSFAW